MTPTPLVASDHLREVRYEIRGPLARRAAELEKAGYEVVQLNIGNPGVFGFRMPETMRLAMIENLQHSEAYCPSKGIFPAREAVVMQFQERGVLGLSAENVVMGNGVSELIMMCMRALLNPGDEVLVPSPDYPLWTASVVIHEGKALHYPCRPEHGFVPQLDDLEAMVTPRTRAIVLINPNNPTGASYPRETLERIAEFAHRHHLVVLADEIYDSILYDEASFTPMATLVEHGLCVTFSGLSKVYRACGIRVGWAAFTGDIANASEYLDGIETLASLRLCANVPGQWAVQTALGGYQSIRELVAPGGRLHQSRQAVIDACAASKYLSVHAPDGAMYAFIKVDTGLLPEFDDQTFAMDLLEQKRVLVAPGSSFNVPYRDHFRIAFLPEAQTLSAVFRRIEDLLDEYAAS